MPRQTPICEPCFERDVSSRALTLMPAEFDLTYMHLFYEVTQRKYVCKACRDQIHSMPSVKVISEEHVLHGLSEKEDYDPQNPKL